MSTLITGGTGFTGAEVTRILLEKGEKKPIDDSCAREEWGWKPEYDQERIVEDFLQELTQNPQRYR
jgi:nucleoside-diphosphate-sugar epimerase